MKSNTPFHLSSSYNKTKKYSFNQLAKQSFDKNKIIAMNSDFFNKFSKLKRNFNPDLGMMKINCLNLKKLNLNLHRNKKINRNLGLKPKQSNTPSMNSTKNSGNHRYFSSTFSVLKKKFMNRQISEYKEAFKKEEYIDISPWRNIEMKNENIY